jgi:hypothetical protein
MKKGPVLSCFNGTKLAIGFYSLIDKRKGHTNAEESD